MAQNARLEVAERLLHARDGAVHVDQLRAEAHKVRIVLVDDLHQLRGAISDEKSVSPS